jgi:hypothetical protein
MEKKKMDEGLSDLDKILFPRFLNVLQSDDIIIDLGENSTLNLSITKNGNKFIKYAKKLDKHFNIEAFIEKVITLSIEYGEKLEKKEQIEAVK